MFKPSLIDTEFTEYIELTELLEGLVLSNDEDCMIWEEGKKNFSVKVVAKSLGERRRLDGNLGVVWFPYEKIWKTEKFICSAKSGVFLLDCFRGRALTVDHLINRGLQLINRCGLCKINAEDIAHLFGSCSFVLKIWEFFHKSFGVRFDSQRDLRDICDLEEPRGLSFVGSVFWKMSFHAIMWGVWCERNRRCFEGKERLVEQIIIDIQTYLWEWSSGMSRGLAVKLDNVVFDWEDLVRL